MWWSKKKTEIPQAKEQKVSASIVKCRVSTERGEHWTFHATHITRNNLEQLELTKNGNVVAIFAAGAWVSIVIEEDVSPS